MVPSNQVGVSNRPYRRTVDDHRKAARSLRRCWGRARERLCYRRTTPPVGTRPSRVSERSSEAIEFIGAPDTIRTCGLHLRRATLRLMLPISEWRSQPIAWIGCCERPQPTILAYSRSPEQTFHFAGIGCCVSPQPK